jgi:hypothetical protein
MCYAAINIYRRSKVVSIVLGSPKEFLKAYFTFLEALCCELNALACTYEGKKVFLVAELGRGMSINTFFP